MSAVAADLQPNAAVASSSVAARRTVLMVAFQFPPFAESTGAQRVVSFVRHLPLHGWTPVVLTASESTYLNTDGRSLELVSTATEIVRAGGWDTARDLSIGGRYPRWLALPDRWVTWAVAACWKGLRVIRAHRPDALWATFPIPSALLSALMLHRVSGIPLVVDLRDPIVYEHWPDDPTVRWAYAWIERKIVQAASRIIVTTPGARRLYVDRYPDIPPDRVCVIANGIDDEAIEVERGNNRPGRSPIRLLHSGLMEIPDRDPTAFLLALAALRDRRAIMPKELQVVLRATGQDDAYRVKVRELGLTELVQVAGRLPRSEAIAEMDGAHGLLLFQGSVCNRQIPAKAYEYLARQRPIIGLCDPRGDTYDLLARAWGVPYMADMADPEGIALALERFLAAVRSGLAFVPSAELIARHSRRAAVAELAVLLDRLTVPAA